MNTIKMNREAEAQEKELQNIKEKGIVETQKDVENGELRTQRNEDGQVLGVNGGKYLQRMIIVAGIPCMITGKDEAELKEDEQKARIFAKEHGNNPYYMQEDVRIAEDLEEADVEPDEELEMYDKRYLLVYKDRIIMDTEGHTVANLDDIPEELSDATIKTLLTERLQKYAEEKEDEEQDDTEDDED